MKIDSSKKANTTTKPTIAHVYKETLDNGVRVLLDPMPQVRSASIGLYIDAGSANELPQENGTAHCIEHMLFKGTTKHSSRQLSEIQNLLGGQINAYTNTETLCLHASVVDNQLLAAMDIMTEMMLESLFSPAEIERERTVILDEIAMCEDDPEEAIMDLFLNTIYPNHPLGRPIIGTAKTVAQINQDDLLSFMHREFTPDRLILSVTGNFDLEQIREKAHELLDNLKPGATGMPQTPLTVPETRFSVRHEHRKLQQTHLCLGGIGPHRTHKDWPGFNLMMMALGGSTSSRIFQQIRENNGLAYNIGATGYPGRNTGCYIIDGATTNKNLDRVVDLCRKEIDNLRTRPITDYELRIARQQCATGLLLGLESTNARMSRMATSEMLFGRHVSVEEAIDQINKITTDDIAKLADQYLIGTPYALTTIGAKASA
ncbi:insulinase family protein [Candidatus Sumerlaeota bacterium]|nr:insulinase family protein [Candidatus Sumerlaeota bacterium]